MSLLLLALGLLVGAGTAYIYLLKIQSQNDEVIKAELLQLKAELSMSKENLTQANQQNQEHAAKLNEMSTELRQAQQNLTEWKVGKESLEKQLQDRQSEWLQAKQVLESQVLSLQKQKDEASKDILNLNGQLTEVQTLIKSLSGQLEAKQIELKDAKVQLNLKIDQVTKEKNGLLSEVSAYKESEAVRLKEHQKDVTRLNETMESFKQDRARLEDERKQEKEEELTLMKETWQRHEGAVESSLRTVCEGQHIKYVDRAEFPHRGTPDNVVSIKGEYIIFDAKSPADNNLSNFPKYVKEQAEKLKKYANHADVKKDMFLVVPSNTLEHLSTHFYPLGDIRVFVIGKDALEPILVSLKRIEDYEFADKLSPEDREQIISFIGKLTHGIKRRVQVDQYFQKEFLHMLSQEESLPIEFSEPAEKIEKSQKMNPPMDRTAKVINPEILKKESNRLDGMILGQGIRLDEEVLEKLEAVPLTTEPEEGAA